MANRDDQNKTSTSVDVLSQKDASVFKNMMELYNCKNYKKALKIAETLLAKYPNHGETLSVKALLLLFIEPTREEEIIELAKRGLRNGINSYMCWHVLGVIYKHVKRYRETSKCFIMALKLDPTNDRLLKEICCLEIELKDYSGFRRFASTQLKLKSKEYREWMLFAFSQHLCGNLSSSCEILEEADKLFSSDYKVESYELSESIMYRAMLYEHLGEFEKCAQLLEEKSSLLKDKITYLELRAKALYLSKKCELANNVYRQLLDLNPNNARFVFMLFLTHQNPKVRNLFLLQFNDYERPKRGSIYDEQLKKDSKNFVEKTVKIPEDNDYPILLSNEILDLDGDYSSAGWNLENRIYHNFDMYINAKASEKDADEFYQYCHSYVEYSFRVSRKLDLSDLPDSSIVKTIEDLLAILDDYLMDHPYADLVVYNKYRRHAKRDKYPLFMFTRVLKKEEEDLLLESLDSMYLKDPFIYNSFVFLFTSGMNFYRRAQKYIIESLNRGSTNIIRCFLHCLTFKKAYILLFILSGFTNKLTNHQRIDTIKNEVQVKWSDHLVSCNYRLVLLTLFLAKVYDYLGDYRMAMEVLSVGFEVTPTSVDLLCLRGKVYRHMGDFYRSNDDYCTASDIDRSDRQTSAKSAKSILRTYDFEFGVTRWKSFLIEDICRKNDKEAPPEIPSFKFELMYAKFKLDMFLKSCYNHGHESSIDNLKDSFNKYRCILDKHLEIYDNQLDFHNYCLNRLAFRVYYNFLKLRSVYCAQGYFIKALKGAIICSTLLFELGLDTDIDIENKYRHKNISYCVELMKTVLTQRVYDPGLYGLFYKLASICDMDLLFKLQCITHCYYSSRCNKLNYHLMPMLYHLLSNLGHCSQFELELIRKTLKLCIDESLGPDSVEINPHFAEVYLDFLLGEVVNKCYELKQIKGLVLCAYNYRNVTFLEQLFENCATLYEHIIFKDYMKFKRFLIYAVHSCHNGENREFLQKQIRILESECSKNLVLDIF